MKLRHILAAAICTAALAAHAADPTMTPKDGYPAFALGADVSWTPYIEANHLHTYYKGYTVDPADITSIGEMVSDHGIDAVRLRVWVDPTNPTAIAGFNFSTGGYTTNVMSTFGTCFVDEMVALARRFAMQGQRLMVVFQMSDTWADPARQFIPAAWAECADVDALAECAAAHVTDVLTRLHDANVNVAWVQPGNEVNVGMLKYQLPTDASVTTAVTSVPFGCEIGSATTTTNANFIKVFNRCAEAAKAVYPDTKVVLHLANGDSWSGINWTLNLLKRAGLSPDRCDYVGLSLYPGINDGTDGDTSKWRNSTDKCITTIANIYKTYGYRTIICEMGLNNEYSSATDVSGVSPADAQRANIEQCNADVRAMTQYLINKLADDKSTCDGLFYWEPETDYMKGYTKGACVSITPGPSWPRDKVTANDWWIAVSEASSFPAGGLIEYRISDNTEPDPGEDPTPSFKPNPDLELYIYYYDTTDHFIPMTTSDGLVYHLTDFAAKQWFNFKVASADWSVDLGNAEVGLDQEGYLNSANNWSAWTSTAVTASQHWWYRHDTHAMIITADSECPWADAGVGAVVADNDTATEYFDLRGIRVGAPRQGLYIVRQGSHTSKTIITNE